MMKSNLGVFVEENELELFILLWPEKLNHGNMIYMIPHAYSVMLTGFCLEGRTLLLPSRRGQICATVYAMECGGSDSLKLQFDQQQKYCFSCPFSSGMLLQGHFHHILRKSRLNRDVIISNQLLSQPKVNANTGCEWMNGQMLLSTIFWFLHPRPYILTVSVLSSALFLTYKKNN